jgi:hypothetical protein
MDMVSTNATVERWSTAECNVWTKVIFSDTAVVAFLARLTGLDSHRISRFEVCDI